MVKKNFMISLALLTLALSLNSAHAITIDRSSHINSNLTNKLDSKEFTPEFFGWHSSASSLLDRWIFRYTDEDQSGSLNSVTIYNSDIPSYFTGSKVFDGKMIMYFSLNDQIKSFIDVYGLENLGFKINVGNIDCTANNKIDYSIVNGYLKVEFTPVFHTVNNSLWQGTSAWNSMNAYGKISIPTVKSGYGTNYLSATINGITGGSLIVDSTVLNAAYKNSSGSMSFSGSGYAYTSLNEYVPLSSVLTSATVWGGGSHGVYFQYPMTISFYDTTIHSNNITISDTEYFDGSTYWVKAGDNFKAIASAYTSDDSNVVKVNSEHLRVVENGTANYVDAKLHSNQTSIGKWSNHSVINLNESLSGASRNGRTLTTNFVVSIDGDKDISIESLSRLVQFNADFSTENVYRQVYSDNTLYVKSDSSGPTITFPTKPTWINSADTIKITTSDNRSGVASLSVRYRVDNGAWSTPSSSDTVSLTSDGVYDIEATAIDKVGNKTVSTKTYKVDKTAPKIVLIKNPSAWTNGDVTITATILETGSGVSIKKWASGSQPASYFAGAGTSIAFNNFQVSTNGTYTFYIKDIAGNESVTTINITNIEKVAPVITLSQSPTTWTNGDVNITANIIETDSGVDIRKWASGNQAVGYFASGGTTITSNSFTVSTNGTYTFYVKDVAGNESVATINITNIDKVLPTITGTLDYPWIKTNRTIALSSTDNDSGILSLKLWNSNKTTVLVNGNVNNKTADLTYLITQEGITKYVVESIDVAGNILTKDVTVRVDNTTPKASIYIPSTTNNKTFQISFSNAIDIHSGVKEAMISESSSFGGTNTITFNLADINSLGGVKSTPFTLSAKTTMETHFSERTIYIRLFDNVGNYTDYNYKISLIPKKPNIPVIEAPTENQLFIGTERILLKWTYDSQDVDLGYLPQLKAEIELRNLDTGTIKNFEVTGEIFNKSLTELENGDYEVKVKVYNYNNVYSESAIRKFRFNKYKNDGNFLTIDISPGSPIKYVSILTKSAIPIGTSLTGRIYYNVDSTDNILKDKYISFEIRDVNRIGDIIKLPRSTKKVRVEYFLKGSTLDRFITPEVDNVIILAR